MKIAILGAGLTGLSAAYHLKKDYAIYEKESAPGGLCRSCQQDGFTFDIAGHLLHFRNEENLYFVRRLLGANCAAVDRNSWVRVQKRFIPYPFQCHLYGLDKALVRECLSGFKKAKEKPHAGGACENFEEWIYANFGRGIARHFMIPYNRKFWRLPLRSLEASWAKKWIPVPSIKEVEEGARGISKKKFGYNATFWYPRQGGIQALVDSLESRVAPVATGCEAVKINTRDRIIIFKNGREVRYENIISTLPLLELGRMITPLPDGIKKAFSKLKFISVYNVNLGVKKPLDPYKHWIYFPDRRPSFYRMGFASNFSNRLAPLNATALYFEFSYSPARPFNKSNVIEKIRRSCSAMGFYFEKKDIATVQVNDIKYGYCLYTKERLLALDVIRDYLKNEGILSCGRYGSWQYSSMEDALVEGQRSAQVFLKERGAS